MLRLFSLLSLISFSLFSLSFKAIMIENVRLSQKDVFLQYCGGVAVDKNIIIFCDGGAGNFKIYNKRGMLKNVFGRKGYGPDEFNRPVIHDYYNSILVVGNQGTYRTRLYKKNKENKLIFKKEYIFRGTDAKLAGNRILYCGITKQDTNGELYNLFSIDTKTSKVEYLIPFKLQFGEKTKNIIRRKNGRRKRLDESIIAYDTYCEIYKGYAFFIWSGNLSVMKFDLNSKKIFRFGEKTKNYFKPYLSENLRKGYEERDIKKYRNAKKKMSWVTGIFVEERFIAVIYTNYNHFLDLWVPYIQFYSREGKFINEIKLKEIYSVYNFVKFFFDKKNKRFYGISQMLDKNDNDVFRVIGYKFIQ